MAVSRRGRAAGKAASPGSSAVNGSSVPLPSMERACSQSWAKGRGSVGEEAERIENLIICCVK